jgi:hypothetical protein
MAAHRQPRSPDGGITSELNGRILLHGLALQELEVSISNTSTAGTGHEGIVSFWRSAMTKDHGARR